jgi:hypothetical protein
VLAQGYGVIVIRPINSPRVLALWPSYYYPNAPQNNVSPNDIKHNLLLLSVITSHTSHINIKFPSHVTLQFTSIPFIVSSSGLDLFEAGIVKPKSVSHPPFDTIV